MLKNCLIIFLSLVWMVPAWGQPSIDADQLLRTVAVLASDSLEGRRAGSEGGAKARAYIQEAFARIPLRPFEEAYEHTFTFPDQGSNAVQAANVIGYLEGVERPDTFIVITAHYDHLGIRRGEIFNGADDNASGVAGLLALAEYFNDHPPRHTMVFAALDAEESGLRGARAFLNKPPVPPEQILLNVNLDMISRNAQGELFAAGTFHTPALGVLLKPVAERGKVHLRFGHDQPGSAAGEDWTHSSDHGPFHQSGIPYVYFGVEDHPDYHQHTDDYENIAPEFFIRSVETILDAVIELDAHLEDVENSSGP